MSQIFIVPKPVSVTESSGVFTLKPSTRIRISKEAQAVGAYCKNLLEPATGFSLKVETGEREQDTITLSIAASAKELGSEGYELTVTPRNIVIRAGKPAGLFYGVQTLRQLLPAAIESQTKVTNVTWDVPAVTIKDHPRFAWRGLHLDVSRHMYPIEFIKKFIDLLAMHKMNVFHWHLTDDQGWRIEIKKYPRLTQVGSQRAATPFPADREKLDGKPYGGFYTQAQVQEIVAYAAARFITVIPEIEMPGHGIAALASYPELGCTKGPYAVRSLWGIEEDVYCAGNEKTFTFLEDVLTEVLDLFPSKIIHIGGDECPKARWKQCPACQTRIKNEGLENEEELQSYFIKRMEKFLNAKGRQIMGWDEILEGGLAPNAAVMCWHEHEFAVKAARAGHDVVMTPMAHCYFDYYQSQDKEKEPPTIGGFLPLETVYNFEPVPAGLSAGEAKHIIGAQGNIWTEYLPTEKLVEYMTFPRACALAEAAWSPAERNYPAFLQRLEKLVQHLGNLGVNYRRLT